MTQKKLSSEYIDDYIDKQNLKGEQKEILKQQSGKTWFRQYAKKSKENLKKITEKVKKGIKHGKYTYDSKDSVGGDRGFVKPKIKKEKKQKTGKKKATGKKKVSTTTKQGVKRKVEMPKKMSKRKEKEIARRIVERAPSGRKYDDVELHEGLGSKRATEWRINHGIPADDFSKRK